MCTDLLNFSVLMTKINTGCRVKQLYKHALHTTHKLLSVQLHTCNTEKGNCPDF